MSDTIYADSFGGYDTLIGINPIPSQTSLLRRYNGISTGGSIYVLTGAGNRGQNALYVGFGAGICQTFQHETTYVLGTRIKLSSDHGVGGGTLYRFANEGTILCSLLILNDGSVVVFAVNNTSLIACSSGVPVISADVPTYIELTASISGTINMALTATVSINGVDVCNGTVLTGTNSSSLYNKLPGFNRVFLDSGVNSNGRCLYTDLYLRNDSPIGPCEIDAHPLPNADGATHQWTPKSGGSHFVEINENPCDLDASYVETLSVGNVDSYGWQDLATLNKTIKSVQLTYWARTNDEGAPPRQFQGTIGAGGTEEQTQTYGLSTDYIGHHQCFDTDPATGVDWTVPLFNAKEFGIKLVA